MKNLVAEDELREAQIRLAIITQDYDLLVRLMNKRVARLRRERDFYFYALIALAFLGGFCAGTR